MNTCKIDSKNVFALPTPALLVAYAALCVPAVGCAVPLLGAAESFVVLSGSSFGHGGGNANTGNHVASEGMRRSDNGGSSTAGVLQRGDALLGAGSAGSAGGAVRPSNIPSRLVDAAYQDRAQDSIVGALLHVLPCLSERSGNSAAGTQSAPSPQARCASNTAENTTEKTTEKATDLGLLNIANAIRDVDAPLAVQIATGIRLASLVPGNPDELIHADINNSGTTRRVESGEGRTSDNDSAPAYRAPGADPASAISLNPPALVGGLLSFPDTLTLGGVQIAPAAVSVTAIPEPSLFALFGLGLLAAVGLARRRQ